MSFKIEGVASGSAKGPYKKGQVVPLSPEKKLIVQCKEEVAKMALDGFMNLTTDAIVSGEIHTIQGKGVKFNDPTQYHGNVTLTYRPMELKSDRIFPERVATFKIQIEDTIDSLGVDDLKTLSFSQV